MATHKSAEKRNRQSIKLRERNKSNRSAVKTIVHSTLADIKKDAKSALKSISTAASLIAKTAHKGSIPKGRAARKISRLYKARNKLLTAAN